MRPSLTASFAPLRAGLRAARWIPVAVLAACASTSTPEEPERDPGVAGMVSSMLDSAERRTNLNLMRVVVVETEEVASDATYANKVLARETELASVAQALEQELVVAFSRRVHVLAVQLSEVGEEPADEPAVLAAVKAAGGTHAVLGTFQRRDDELVITVRLVDARTRLIVAAERMSLPFTHFSDVGRLAFEAGRDPFAEGAMSAVGLAALGGGGATLEPVVLKAGTGSPAAPSGKVVHLPPQGAGSEPLAYGAGTSDVSRATSLEYGATNAPLGGVPGAAGGPGGTEGAVSLAGTEPAFALPPNSSKSAAATQEPEDQLVRFQKSKVLKRRSSNTGPAAERLKALGRPIEPQ